MPRTVFICSPVPFLPSWSHCCTKQYFTFCRCSLCIVRARSCPPQTSPTSEVLHQATILHSARCNLRSLPQTLILLTTSFFRIPPPYLPVYCDTLRAPPKPPAHPAAWFVSTGTRFGAKRRTFSLRTPRYVRFNRASTRSYGIASSPRSVVQRTA